MVRVGVGNDVPVLVKAMVDVHVQADTVIALNLGHVVVELRPIPESILNGDEVFVGIREPGGRH